MGAKRKGRKQHDQEDEQEQTETHHKKQEVEKENDNEGQKQKVEVIAGKKIQYCPICTFPFELCKYGKKAADCKRFLMEIAPTKVSKYHPDNNAIVDDKKDESQNKQGQKTEKPQKQQKVEKNTQNEKQGKESKKQKAVKQKFIHVDVKQRQKKKFVSQISGLANFKIDSKQLSKKLCKKFACSCSAQDQDKVVVQGDFFQQIKQILINQYKVKKKYILDKQEYKQKLGEQKQKKKQERKQGDKDKAEQKIEQPFVAVEPAPVRAKTAAQNMLAGLSSDQEN